MSEEAKNLQLHDPQKQEIVEEGVERTRARLAFVPRVDIYETQDAILLTADMPGVDEKSVDLTLEKGVLTLNGYVEPKLPEDYSLAYAEYRVGDYQRSFTLSNEIDQEHIEATVRNGVLHVRLPKLVAASKKIAVKGA